MISDNIEYIVVIMREGGQLDTSVVPFSTYEEAKTFADEAGQSWSDTYVCKVLDGPKV